MKKAWGKHEARVEKFVVIYLSSTLIRLISLLCICCSEIVASEAESQCE